MREETIDMNVCYRKAFEAMKDGVGIQELVDDMTDYAPVTLLVLDISGKFLAVSAKGSDRVDGLPVCLTNGSHIFELASQLADSCENGRTQVSLMACIEEIHLAINTVVINDDIDGFVISIPDISMQAKPQWEKMVCQFNDIVCQAIGMIWGQRNEKLHQHVPLLRKAIARLLFEGNPGQLLKGGNDIYGENIISPFMVVILQADIYNRIQMQKIENMICDRYGNVFTYIKEQQMYLLFTDIHTEKCKENLLDMLSESCERYCMSCGISNPFEDIGLADKKRFMCKKALEIGMRQKPEERCFHEDDYYLLIACSCALEKIGHARYLEQELQALWEEDNAKDTKFSETLKQYLLAGNNVSLAAKRLFIHRNTMIYRLSKISAHLGVDINEPATAHRLLVSMILQEEERGRGNPDYADY